MKASDAIRAWRSDIVRFVREVFAAEPDAWQALVLRAFQADPRRRVALKASKGVGKTTVEAWCVLWFMTCHAHATGIACSITKPNLRDNLWTEIAKWRSKSPFLTTAFEWTAERLFAKQHPATWWFSARAFAQDADAEAQAQTLAGLHGENVVVILDEVGGYPNGVVVAAEGIQSVEGQNTRILVAGNPDSLTGPLHRIATTEREQWWIYEISGDPDDANRAPRVDIEWARAQISKWGRDSSFVRTNVLGQFPLAQNDALLGADDCAKAMAANPRGEDFEEFPRIMGVDVARSGGDRSVCFLRQGRIAYSPEVFRELDSIQLAGQITRLWKEWKVKACGIDITGGTGTGTYDLLKAAGYRVTPITFGAGANDDRSYANKRAEMWWSMREWIRSGGALPEDSELIKELTAPKYRFTPKGQLILEHKPDLVKRLGFSPDKADALACTFGVPVPPPEEFEAMNRQHNAGVYRAVTDYDLFDPGRA